MRLGKEQVYFTLMLLSGAACGVIASRNPELARGSFPPLLWILFASLVIDLVMMRLPGNRGLATIAMPWRVAAFICAAGLYTAISAFAPAAP